METKSRTQYSAYNTTVGLISRFMAIIMGYVVRIVFTHMLSENYVGVNGLFTDILNVLSLSEMGIETAEMCIRDRLFHLLYINRLQKMT